MRRGHLDDRPTYWNGTSWTPDASAAIAVMPRDGRTINPAQVRWTGTKFVAVTKVGDWFGDTIYVDTRSHRARPVDDDHDASTAAPLCDDCNTYFASLVAWSANSATLTIGISNNTWDGRQSGWYHPRLVSIPMPARPTEQR